jgi:translation initiation factor IF-2
MHNDLAKSVKAAGPSYAVEILGMNGVPDAGESFFAVENEQVAREICEKRLLEHQEALHEGRMTKHVTLDALYSKIQSGELQELKIIIKADVQGSAEALKSSLEKLSSDKVRLRVIHSQAGGINESDVMLASASDAVIIGFHVKPDLRAQDIIEREQVDVRFYSIIYEAVEDVKRAMQGMLAPTLKEVVTGTAEVREIFKISKLGTVAGCHVLKGKVIRNARARLIRDNVIAYEGKLASLKRFKEDAREVAEGYDCGIGFEQFNDIKLGDRIETYRIEELEAKL